MAALTRTNVAFFAIEDALTLAEVEALRDADALLEHILPVDSVFAGYPAVTVTEKAEKRLYNGNPVPWEACRSRSDEENVTAKPGADNPKSAGTDGGKSRESGAAMYRVYDRQGHLSAYTKGRTAPPCCIPTNYFLICKDSIRRTNMEYIKDPDFHLENTAVALGKFEGLHRGHQLLFDEIKKQKKAGLKSVVFTFDMPPRSALSGDQSYQQIYTKEERRFLLKRCILIS